MTTKELETLRARCALTGLALSVTEDDCGQAMYIVSRWDLSLRFATAGEVETWLARVTERAHQRKGAPDA